MPYAPPRYPFRPVTDQGARHPVIVVGGGMVGLTAALDLAQRGQPVLTSTIGNRTGFSAAFALGLGVTETAPRSLAARELQALSAEILEVHE